MTISGTTYTHLLLFFLLAAPTMAEFKSPMIQSGNHSSPTSYPIEYTFFLESWRYPLEYTILFVNWYPKYHSETDPSSRLKQLSHIYFDLSIVYLFLLGCWIYSSLKINTQFRRIHFLMAGLIVIKAITLICAGVEKHYERITESDYVSDQLNNVRHIIISVRLLLVIQLIETGWAHVKPILQVFDKIVLMILIPLQILSNVALVQI
ncbi:hypothetical protein LXL04_006680 [Taraxacum kok-saghyz]